jgi:hypothetical protein
VSDAADDRLIGPWRLGERLGKGGNATVWRAINQRGDGDECALKVLNSAKVGGEPYRRFQAEVATMRRLDDHGVLPLLAAYLLDSLSKRDPAWLAMPLATPLDTALAGASVERVVEACTMISETLARLQIEQSLGHRDIKPGNLYELDERWLVGDFGLAADPTLTSLTPGDRPLGPRHFSASELILDPAGADPASADVYSLAKTLWVLVAEQRFPPEGHQPATGHSWSLATLRPHPRAHLLDQLISQATHLRPENRPTMSEVVSELRAWSSLELTPEQVNLAAAAARVREAVAKDIDAEQVKDTAKEVALAAARTLQARLKPLEDVLQKARPGMQIVPDDKPLNGQLRSFETMQGPSVEWRWQRIAVLKAGQAFLGYGLRTGVSVELLDTGQLVFRAASQVSYDAVTGVHYQWASREITVPAAPIASEGAIGEIVDALSEQMEGALDAFAANVPGN